MKKGSLNLYIFKQLFILQANPLRIVSSKLSVKVPLRDYISYIKIITLLQIINHHQHQF